MGSLSKFGKQKTSVGTTTNSLPPASATMRNDGYTNLEKGAQGGPDVLDGVRVMPPEKSCYDKFKGLVAAVFLSVLTASLFLLRSGPLASKMCSNVILIYCEALKFLAAMIYVLLNRQTPKLFEGIPLAFVPVSSYVAVNLLSFWALKYVHASLGALMSQIKLPATAVFSYFFLGRTLSFDRTMAVITIFLGSLAIASYGQVCPLAHCIQKLVARGAPLHEHIICIYAPAHGGVLAIPRSHTLCLLLWQMQKEGETDTHGFGNVPMMTYILATVALIGESCLSAATGVFTQWVFKG